MFRAGTDFFNLALNNLATALFNAAVHATTSVDLQVFATRMREAFANVEARTTQPAKLAELEKQRTGCETELEAAASRF